MDLPHLVAPMVHPQEVPMALLLEVLMALLLEVEVAQCLVQVARRPEARMRRSWGPRSTTRRPPASRTTGTGSCTTR